MSIQTNINQSISIASMLYTQTGSFERNKKIKSLTKSQESIEREYEKGTIETKEDAAIPGIEQRMDEATAPIRKERISLGDPKAIREDVQREESKSMLRRLQDSITSKVDKANKDATDSMNAEKEQKRRRDIQRQMFTYAEPEWRTNNG